MVISIRPLISTNICPINRIIMEEQSALLDPETEQCIISIFFNPKISTCHDIDTLKIKPIKCIIDLNAPLLTHISALTS